MGEFIVEKRSFAVFAKPFESGSYIPLHEWVEIKNNAEKAAKKLLLQGKEGILSYKSSSGLISCCELIDQTSSYVKLDLFESNFVKDNVIRVKITSKKTVSTKLVVDKASSIKNPLIKTEKSRFKDSTPLSKGKSEESSKVKGQPEIHCRDISSDDITKYELLI